MALRSNAPEAFTELAETDAGRQAINHVLKGVRRLRQLDLTTELLDFALHTSATWDDPIAVWFSKITDRRWDECRKDFREAWAAHRAEIEQQPEAPEPMASAAHSGSEFLTAPITKYIGAAPEAAEPGSTAADPVDVLFFQCVKEAMALPSQELAALMEVGAGAVTGRSMLD